MKWRKKKNPISTTNKEEEEDEEEEEVVVGNDEPNTIRKPSSFSKNINLSKILPFSSWLSKIKPKRSTTAPITPKPLLSPRPLPNRTQPAEAIPRRLSVGDEDTHLTRSRASQSLLPRRHNSFGSEIELRSDLHLLDLTRNTPRRRRRKPRPAPDPPRSGRRSSAGGRIRPRVRVCSPRLANPNPMGRLESYAVVKRSRDPARDFRESMVEMIWEKGIGRSDELESLLACYLSLNSDEHHDVIVKVFRQVWFDFNRRMDPGF